MPRVEQRAEIAGDFPECEQLIEDTVDAAADHERVEHILERHCGRRHREIMLEYIDVAMTHALNEQIPVIEPVRAVRILGVTFRSGIIVSYKNALAHPPVAALRRVTAERASFFMLRPVGRGP